MILPVINQAGGLHFAEFSGKGRAVYFKVVGQLLTVKRDVKLGVFSNAFFSIFLG